MKIALVIRSIVNFRYLGDLPDELCRRGHEVIVVLPILHSYDLTEKQNTTDRALSQWVASHQSASTEKPEIAQGRRGRFMWQLRNVLGYSIYFHPLHTSPGLSKRWEMYVPRVPRALMRRSRLFHKALTSRATQKALRAVQKRVPPDPAALSWLEKAKPDLVIASPFIINHSAEAEMVQAARHLGIPTLVSVLSWDNLTTKGTFYEMPDAVFLWNDALKKEAETIHAVPRCRIFSTGAPTFDFWFDMKPSVSREEFCRQAGIDPSREIVTYLGSSRGIAENESDYVRELVEILAGHEAAGNIHLLVRPHPLNAQTWENFGAPNTCLWPRGGDWPDSDEAKQQYFNTLWYSRAVVGVNTSAFLDSAVLDKPCVTALTPHYHHSQSGRGHFQHLVNADFLETAHSFEELAEILGAIVAGRDDKAENRRRFVREFIRPRGIDARASEVFARAAELVAERQSVAQIEEAIAREYSQEEKAA